ncbi:hypothetical protein A3A68_01395 [Candidatus Saccharibacteria bacterium RIFCSPLOWO2_01_FULL_48_13]|nr:MAG: hypothetical protein A2884_00320 [Candidatus Saccharibacteria bacterium RIFCSPHIGHO2_01_FULL_48_12]OGL36789.1 MAG: hypothetical protein A3F38_02575 [Candidatus Saccharibacteria bacterium RIFCSPHIGHO2_12_FULL_48_21]OGL37368.1 MAG: hypothetical protein A3A68_01395 [Candidatus Saccharibacteria bacterium RIFCSPLOWO2_01_FULL_48_13]
MAVAIDVFWQFGCQRPLSKTAMRRIRCNLRHARGDRCKRYTKGKEKHVRASGLERIERREAKLQVEENGLEDDSLELFATDNFDLEYYETRKERKALRRAAKNYRRRVRRADRLELTPEETERAFMFEIEKQFRHARERIPDLHERRRLLGELCERLARTKSPVGQLLLVETQTELCRLQVLTRY